MHWRTLFVHAISDGSWRSDIVRQPIQYSTFTETAYAVRALQLYSSPGGRPSTKSVLTGLVHGSCRMCQSTMRIV